MCCAISSTIAVVKSSVNLTPYCSHPPSPRRLDDQVSPLGGCLTISGPATPAAYAAVAWQPRYINGAEFGLVPGPRTINYVAIDSNNAVSAVSTVAVNVVGNTTIGPCPGLNSVAGTPFQATTISGAAAATNAKVPILTNFIVETNSTLFQAHVRITEGCLPQDTLLLNYAGGAPLDINAQYFPATCDLTLTTTGTQSNDTWTAAIQNVVYLNSGTANVTARLRRMDVVAQGVRGISFFLGQNEPVGCNTPYGSATLTIGGGSSTATPSQTPSTGSSPSVSPLAGGHSGAAATGVSAVAVAAVLLLASTLLSMQQ